MQLGGYFLKGVFDTSISFKDAELVYSKSVEMNHQQTYRESSVYAGWMNRVLVKEDSFSPQECTRHPFNINNQYNVQLVSFEDILTPMLVLETSNFKVHSKLFDHNFIGVQIFVLNE